MYAERGNCFEVYANSSYRHLGAYQYYPELIRKNLNLPELDRDIDLIAEILTENIGQFKQNFF